MSSEKQGKRLSDVLPAEITDTPIIGMNGCREITVDGFKGIDEYNENEVSFRAGCLTVSVEGEELSIKYLSLHTIVICGGIKRVEFLKRS